MAGALHLQSRSGLDALFSKKVLNKKDVLKLSFRKELDRILNCIKNQNNGDNFEELESTTKL